MRCSTILAAVFALLSLGDTAAVAREPDFESILRFEAPREGATLAGWGGGPAETLHFDGEIVHAGSGAARVERDAESSGEFSSLTKSLTIDFGGQWIELRGFLRTEDVDGAAGLWLRQDGSSGPLQFTSMPAQQAGLSGTADWAEYSIRLPLVAGARDLVFGVLLSGQGRVWADDLELRVDDKPLSEAPERVIEQTILDTDQEFAAGSGIDLTTLTGTQTENVAVLGMMWGFLKYHHPRVAAGELHWDFELFRVLPAVLEAADRDAANRILEQWLETLGVPDSCQPCARPPEDAHLLPRLDWTRDTEALGEELSGHLPKVHARRFVGESFYVAHAPGVGNPVFDNELSYIDQQAPDAGYRILALLRLWNIIEYWFPYRDQLGDDWRSVLREFLPRMVAASDRDAYRLELLAFSAHIRDGHANLWAELDVRPPRGSCRWPVAMRFVEGRATVTAVLDRAPGEASGLELGDVIEAIDGRSVEELVEAWAPFYCASNSAARDRDIAAFLPRGPCGEIRLDIVRRGEAKTITVARLVDQDPMKDPHDRPGETFQLLSEDVAYIKLSSIRVQDVDRYLEQAAGTRGLVIDIRNYPSEFVVFALGSRLVEEPTPFARFTVADAENPGAFTWTEPLELRPAGPSYSGKVTILVDEVSLSQAEYTAMALRAGPRAVVVGSTTAGADGNVSPIPLPGGLRAMISGIGVFYPDKAPTQRVGIVPDIVATPTIRGLREGRDEVLEAAVRHLLGPEIEESRIQLMARWPAFPQ